MSKLTTFVAWAGRTSFLIAFGTIWAELLVYRCVDDTSFGPSGATGCYTFGWDKHHVLHIHPLCMVLGFVCFGSEGILSIQQELFPMGKLWRRRVHGILQLCGLVCITVGLVAIFIFYANPADMKHRAFHSMHAWTGFGTCVLWFLQIVVGLLYHGRLANIEWTSFIPMHTFFGIFTYVMGIATVLNGAQQWIVKQQPTGNFDLNNHEILINCFALSVYSCAFCILYVAMPKREAHSEGMQVGQHERSRQDDHSSHPSGSYHIITADQ